MSKYNRLIKSYYDNYLYSFCIAILRKNNEFTIGCDHNIYTNDIDYLMQLKDNYKRS